MIYALIVLPIRGFIGYSGKGWKDKGKRREAGLATVGF